MADGILYLDVDDEITSVAARVRGASERRVAIVLPPGSRVATSRINFRLLSRDALTHEKRLSIVAGDAAARALAASAGLPVFSSVAEYEASEEGPRPGPRGAASVTPAPILTPPPVVAPPPTVTSPPLAAPSEQDVPITGAAKRRKRGRAAAAPAVTDEAAAIGPAPAAAEPLALPFDDMATSAVPTTALGASAGAASPVTSIPTPPAPTRARPPMARPMDAAQDSRPDALEGRAAREPAAARAPDRTSRRGPALPAFPSFGSIAARTTVIAGLAVLALAALVGGVGAYLLLPSATVVVTPREDPIGPLRMTITADPTITAPDAVAGSVPAETLTVAVDATRTTSATGKRVEEKAAKGVVRFDNFNPVSSNTIPRGSIVSTPSGVRFRTDRSITVPAAQFDPSTSKVTPASATVSVTAVDLGTAGNVPPNSITRVPGDENSLFLDVTNPNATSGGSHKEFPLVTEKDVTAAVTGLTADLQAKFTARLADPSLVADGATVFPSTGTLGPATPSVDPASLVGQELATFDLTATASGTVTAVKTDAVRTVAEQRLAGSVSTGFHVVSGSGDIQTDPGVAQGTTIAFPVVATARQVKDLDPASIRDAIKGRPLGEAQQILNGFGTFDLTVWPDWVSSIPTIDARLDVQVASPPASGDGAAASPSPGP